MPQTMGQEQAADVMDRQWTSGIFKEQVTGRRWLGQTQIDGDGQADLKYHGGPDKAVLAYAADHYPIWREELAIGDIPYGGFGENFTVDGLREENVCIGDTYAIGEALVQVSQPRQPCWKLARRWRISDLAARVQTNGRTGWYFRVLREGHVQPGDQLLLQERPLPNWSVARANELMHRQQDDLAAAAELAASPYLSVSWKKTLSERVAKGSTSDTHARLVGQNQAD